MKHFFLFTFLFTSFASIANDQQYNDASQSIIAIYEIMDNKARICDTHLDVKGEEAISGKECTSFINSLKLAEKLDPECDKLHNWADKRRLEVKELHKKGLLKKPQMDSFTKDVAFITKNCGSSAPSKYKYITKVMKKIDLLRG